MKVSVVKQPLEDWELEWTLFNKNYPLPGPEIAYQQCDGKYVGDSIGEEEIQKWDRPFGIFRTFNYHINSYYTEYSPYRLPVIISAQTGKGKNYFITNTLRKYARKHEQEILYISNRVALGYQQKKELASITGTYLMQDWENQETFENVTVVTYQRLLGRYITDKDKENAEWLNKFKYVVLDECHFFYSDAFFNPFTWEILSKTVELFQNAIRIYLSATPEDVADPIRYFEGPLFGEQFFQREQSWEIEHCTKTEIGAYAIAYHFPRKYSNYKVSFFSDEDQLFSKMTSSKEKWLVFVTSKDMGRQLKKKIDEITDAPSLVT